LVGTDVTAGADGIPGFHGRVLLGEVYPIFPIGILYIPAVALPREALLRLLVQVGESG
jgi:hypothetical protein